MCRTMTYVMHAIGKLTNLIEMDREGEYIYTFMGRRMDFDLIRADVEKVQ